MSQSYRCNFCGKPLSPFKNGTHQIAEIHHLHPIKSNTSRSATWKQAIQKELQSGKEQLEIICGGLKTCHTIVHLKRTSKYCCPDCIKKNLKVYLQTFSSINIMRYRKNHYSCPKCGKKWFKSYKGLIPFHSKQGGLLTCSLCQHSLLRTKRRHYKCPQCNSNFRISQSKKVKWKLIHIP